MADRRGSAEVQAKKARRRKFLASGDNAAKRKMQHRLFGEILSSRRGRHPDKELKILCLPGEDAWDIDYFTSWDHVSKVVGLEADKTVAEKLKSRYHGNPRVEIHHAWTTEYLYNTTEQFNVVYLDYYSNLGISTFYDMELALYRKRIRPAGKLVVSFFAAREPPPDIVAQLRYCEAFHRRHNEPWDPKTDPDRRRMLAVNGFLAELRHRRLDPMNEGFHVNPWVPNWWSYATATAKMITAEIGIPGYVNYRRSHLTERNRRRWFIRSEFYPIKHFEWTGSRPITSSRGRTITYREVWVKRIKQFYAKYDHTPVSRELADVFVLDFNSMVREAGFCPRYQATREEFEGELRRIYERNGYVSAELLRAARLPERLRVVTPWVVEFLDKLGAPKELRTDYKASVYFNRVRIYRRFIDHLASKKPLCYFRGYSALYQRGVDNYVACKTFVDEYERRKASGRYDRLGDDVELP